MVQVIIAATDTAETFLAILREFSSIRPYPQGFAFLEWKVCDNCEPPVCKKKKEPVLLHSLAK